MTKKYPSKIRKASIFFTTMTRQDNLYRFQEAPRAPTLMVGRRLQSSHFHLSILTTKLSLHLFSRNVSAAFNCKQSIYNRLFYSLA